MKKGTRRSGEPGIDGALPMGELMKAVSAVIETEGRCSVEWVFRADTNQWEVLIDSGQQKAEEKSQAEIEPVTPAIP